MLYKAIRCILAQPRQLDKMAYATKAKTQQFARRRPSLIKKADQLARLCNADVALIIRRNGRYYTYRSIDHEQWPPTRSEIVGKSELFGSRLTELKENSYPLPISLVSKDFDFITAKKRLEEKEKTNSLVSLQETSEEPK